MEEVESTVIFLGPEDEVCEDPDQVRGWICLRTVLFSK